MHALVSDPGGEPSARHIAHDSAAFQFPETVGFYSRTSGSYLNDHGSDISGLYAQRKCPWGAEPAFLIHLVSDSRYRIYLRTSLLTCRLGFGQVGLVPFAGTHPLDSNNQFHPEREFLGCGFSSARLELSTI